jgi:alkanesulfonate monooxygenase SsuD/methylene tetrahydromethanopterin reductase-like flavin-dependent oxidoreductase (luciferase family)
MVNPAADTETIARQAPLYRDARSESGRKDGGMIAAFKEVFCAPTREEAISLAAPYLEEKYRGYAAWGQAEAHPGTESLELAFEDLRRSRFVVGDPADCLAELSRWRDEIGIRHFLLRTSWAGMPLETTMVSLRLLAEEVVPALRG